MKTVLIFFGLLALVAADGFHRAGRGGHGRSLQNNRAGRGGRQQNKGGRSRGQAGRRGRQDAAGAGYGAPAEGSADYPDYESSGVEDNYGAPAAADDAYGAPVGDEYGVPAAADDAYGAPEGSADYDDYGADVPLDAYAATEAPAPAYEQARRARTRGGFGSSRRAPAKQNTRNE